jgi:hypothetical protein
VLIRRRELYRSAEKVEGEFPLSVLNEETSMMELTEFQEVEPSPPDIRIWDDGIKPFVGVLA